MYRAHDHAPMPPPTEDEASSHAPREPLAVGQLVSGRYHLDQLIGEGGMGQVFLATDTLYKDGFGDRKAQVAIKFLGQRFAEHSASRVAMQREARRSQELSHPNIVRVYHFDQHGDQTYMIMEYMQGQSLDAVLAHSAPLPLSRALNLLQGMAAALDYMHSKQLVHCDVKPANVFVERGDVVKVLDLGIARLASTANTTVVETEFDAGSLGAYTPAYASCEIFQRLPPHPADDVYALACIAVELFTGAHPFGGLTAPEARDQAKSAPTIAGFNRRQQQALARGLDFQRAQRTDSAGAFYQGLLDREASQRFRQRLLRGVALGALIAAMVGAGIALRDPDPDILFLNSLTPKNPPPLDDAGLARTQRWLEQGQAYLEIARREFTQGRIPAAHHILAGGADNALWAFQETAKALDSPEARDGVLSVVTTYADWSRELASTQPQAALWMACQGLNIHPRHRALNELAGQLAADTTNPAEGYGCKSLLLTQQPPVDGNGSF